MENGEAKKQRRAQVLPAEDLKKDSAWERQWR